MKEVSELNFLVLLVGFEEFQVHLMQYDKKCEFFYCCLKTSVSDMRNLTSCAPFMQLLVFTSARSMRTYC